MMEFAKSLSGHDRNQIYLVKEKDEKFVFLVNGTTKPLAAPKKKKLKTCSVNQKYSDRNKRDFIRQPYRP